jgi:hypothetical protein
LNAFFFEEGFFIRGSGPLDISLFGLSIVDLESLFSKIDSHILEMFVHKILNRLEDLIRINFGLPPSPILFDRKRRKDLFYVNIIADWAIDNARLLLLFERSGVFEPTLKDMAIGTDKIERNHFFPLTIFQFNIPKWFWQVKIQYFCLENT